MVTAAGQCHVYGQGQAIQAALLSAMLRMVAPGEIPEMQPASLQDVAYIEAHLAEHVANDHDGDADQCHVKIYRHDLEDTAPDDMIPMTGLSDAERATFVRLAEQG